MATLLRRKSPFILAVGPQDREFPNWGVRRLPELVNKVAIFRKGGAKRPVSIETGVGVGRISESVHNRHTGRIGKAVLQSTREWVFKERGVGAQPGQVGSEFRQRSSYCAAGWGFKVRNWPPSDQSWRGWQPGH
jgi:hypothetical protein